MTQALDPVLETAAKAIRLLIADAHVAVRTGVVALLSEFFPSAQFAMATSSDQLLQSAATFRPDLVILDFNVQQTNPTEIIRTLKQLAPPPAVLVYTIYPEENYGVRSLRAGADGYLTKDRPVEDLVNALVRIKEGKRYVSDALALELANCVTLPSSSDFDLLSEREHQVLRMIAGGQTQTAIGLEIQLSIKTVNTYRTRILHKLRLKTTSDLIRYATQRHLVD